AGFEAKSIQLRDVASDPLHLNAFFGRSLSGAFQRLVDVVDRSDPPAALGQVDGVSPRAAAHVECSAGRWGIRAFEDRPPHLRDVALFPWYEPEPVEQPVRDHQSPPSSAPRETVSHPGRPALAFRS